MSQESEGDIRQPGTKASSDFNFQKHMQAHLSQRDG